MGRLSFSRAFVGAMLVGGVAVAQQGLIVEPWRKAPAPVAAPVPPLRAMPGSGLGPVHAAPLAPRKAEPPPAPLAPPLKWSPTVIALLVDPWAKVPIATPVARPPRPGWVPVRVDTLDIVDPWADEPRKPEPRVASRRAGAPPSTIF